MSKAKLIIGRIPFLVCLPYFHRQIEGDFDFIDAAPKDVNPMLLRNQIHCSPTSSILFAQAPEQLIILPEISTASDLEIHSVLICSQEPLDNLHQKPIWMSSQSDTSVFLFRLLCKRFLKIQPLFITDPLHQDTCMAQILIGDQALRARHSGQWAYIYELDALWRDWKGLPFVFGLWTLSQAAIQNEYGRDLLRQYFAHLRSNVQDFPSHLDQALADWDQRFGLPLSHEQCREFLQRIDYKLDDARKESLSIFYQESYLAGFLPRPVQPKFFNA